MATAETRGAVRKPGGSAVEARGKLAAEDPNFNQETEVNRGRGLAQQGEVQLLCAAVDVG